MDLQRYESKTGCFIQIPNVGRGQLKYVGVVDNKPGYYAGVDLLANIGKNDGTFNGKRYFETEYPHSGLFIQLAKVASLIERATSRNSSRRGTLPPQPQPQPQASLNYRSSSMDSTGSTVIRRQVSNGLAKIDSDDNAARTPTPIKSLGTPYRGDTDIDMERTPVAVGATTQHTTDEQGRRLAEYERLLNEQRQVLEEIQPAIDEYERQLRLLEAQKVELTGKLAEQASDFKKQLQYYEVENKQLTEVVSQLHEELKESAKRTEQQQQQQQSGGADVAALQREVEFLTHYKTDMEHARIKWDKERDQLKMHNESLSKEYQALNKELLSAATPSKDSSEEIATLKQQLAEAHRRVTELETRAGTGGGAPSTLPVYEPPTRVDAAAGRKLWCVLCEKTGHESIDCPFQYEDNGAADAASEPAPAQY
ncbi:Bik1p KNAG_0C00520 [Huiozyma naganishii CBS 8797]|uniref:CAP-Gly domain-containing protein n=1 Tax=Huiozyma naganishii (strain ATCC MYA-139 / BCRC 22969 / CBS 8797 / KCTC 17520 / NBRC 10181 / NCYC 3082 / Yp74L-3) TaxID=1071383 RepID=J7S5I3_HUIN7|nr:hypothetical protein KNAG_0C00520 [Kazachstania naganishii CBS 8797]CCK69166.1 hypothetical protein KNAG_0C00520 [Kazachstania naganishii CBS 8797]